MPCTKIVVCGFGIPLFLGKLVLIYAGGVLSQGFPPDTPFGKLKAIGINSWIIIVGKGYVVVCVYPLYFGLAYKN